MGYKDNIGEVPTSGAIFMSNIGTKKECFRRKLFGLPSCMSNFVLHVKKGMILFLFEFQKRELFGVFRATSNGHINIVPNAFNSSGKHFPAQVRFTSVWNCSPLAENEFQDAIRDNYFSGKKFNFGLSKDQVCKLMMLFFTKRIPKEHPVRNYWRRGDKLAEGDGRFDDHRKTLVRDRIGFIKKEDYHGLDICEYLDEEVKEIDEVRDRIGYISKEDRHGLDICEYLGDEVKEVNDHVYLNGNFLEEANNINCGGGLGDMTVMVEGPQKDGGDRFLRNYMTQSEDFFDDDSRQAKLGKYLDHSVGGLRRVAEAGLHFMHDVNDVHNNLGEIRGIPNEDRFLMMEKIKDERDVKDGYIPNFTEPHEKHFGKTGAANNDAKFLMEGIANKSKDFMDDNRIQDEYHTINGFWQDLSAQHLGSPRDRGTQANNDGRFSGYESEQKTLNEHPLTKPKGTTDVWIKPNYGEGSTFSPRTLTEHPLFEPRAAGIKPGYDKDFGFRSVPSSTHNSTRGVVSTNDIVFSHCKQNTLNSAGNPFSEAQDSSVSELLGHPSEFSNIGKTYDYGLPHSTSCDTRMITMYDPEVPGILLRPSFFAAGTSSSPADNRPFYRSSKEIHTFSTSTTLPYHSQNKASMRYFDDPGYALSSKSPHTFSCHETRGTHVVEGNWALKTDSREGSQGPFVSEYATPSSTGVETAENVIMGHRSHGFSSSMIPISEYNNRYLEEPGSKYMHKLSESSHASKKLFLSDTGLCPRKEGPIHHDRDFCQPREDKHLDGTDKRVSVFARLTSAPDALRHEQELVTDEQHDLDTSVNNVMKMLEKVVSSPIKRTGKSISAVKQDDNNITAGKIVDYELTKVKMEPDADLANEAIEVGSMLQETRLVDFKRRKKANKSLDDNKSKESLAGLRECERYAGTTTSECLAVSASDVGSVEINSLMGVPCKRRRLVRPVFDRNEPTADGVTAAKHTQPASHENTPSKDDGKSTKAAESWEKVNTQPASHESTPLKDDGKSTKAVESWEKVDTQPTSHESTPSKDDGLSTKAVESWEKVVDTSIKPVLLLAGCQKNVVEGEANSQVEGNGNAENHLVSDIFGGNRIEQAQEKRAVDAMAQVASSKHNQKMCGWIEW